MRTNIKQQNSKRPNSELATLRLFLTDGILNIIVQNTNSYAANCREQATITSSARPWSQLLGKTLFGSGDFNYIWDSMSKLSEIPTGLPHNVVPQCHRHDFATFTFEIARCRLEEKKKATLGASGQYCQFFDANS
jgi:hypothetical protein